MNAINAMERGIMVQSGSENIAMKYLNINNIKNSAVINIISDANQIENEIIKLINMSHDQLL
jgi:CMP-2-keto-3-deoxyoctulosonic acid synthetase